MRRSASARAASRWPGADRAYGAWSPACPGGMSALMASCTTVPCERSGAANRLATTRPFGRATRAASRSARGGSPANWNALTPTTASKAASLKGKDSMSPSRRSASGSRPRAMPSRPGLMSRPLDVAPRWAARTSVSPDPQPTSSTRVPRPTPAASSTASNSGRLCASARSAQACGSVPHRRRWTSAAALIAAPAAGRGAAGVPLMSAVVAGAQCDQAVAHAGDDVVVLVQLYRVREQRPPVVPGDRDRTRPGGVDQPASQPRKPCALLREVRHHPGDVADRARGDAVCTRRDAVRGGEAVVDRVDLAKFHHDRPPGGEGSRVVEHHVVVPLTADGQHELLERHVLDDLERADAEVLAPPRQRGVQVIDPVADVVQARHHRRSAGRRVVAVLARRVVALLAALERPAAELPVVVHGHAHERVHVVAHLLLVDPDGRDEADLAPAGGGEPAEQARRVAQREVRAEAEGGKHRMGG